MISVISLISNINYLYANQDVYFSFTSETFKKQYDVKSKFFGLFQTISCLVSNIIDVRNFCTVECDLAIQPNGFSSYMVSRSRAREETTSHTAAKILCWWPDYNWRLIKETCLIKNPILSHYYRGSPVSKVWSPGNRTIRKNALFGDWFRTKIMI